VKSAAVLAVFGLFAGFSGSAHAASQDNWNVASGGSWATPGNWSTNNPPLATEVGNLGSIIPTAASITLDGARTAYGVIMNVGSGETMTLDAGSSGSLTVLSTDTTTDNSSTFYAFSALSGTNTVNAPIQLGNGSTGSFAVTFFSGVNASNFVLNGGITESAGQTWGVRIAGSGTGIVNYATTGKSYSGDTTITAGGILKLNSDNMIPDGAGKGNLVLEGNGQLQLNNVNETINALISSSTTATITRSGSNTKTFTVGAGDASGAYLGSLTNTGGNSSLTKTGTGSQSFGTVTISNSGVFGVNGGKAFFNSQATGGSINIASGATGGGTGTATLASTLAVTGTLAPGSNNTGVFDVSAGTSNFNAGSKLDIELGGTTPADGTGNYDQLNLTNAAGAVTVNSAATLGVSLVNSFVPASSDIFYVLTHADAGALAAFSGLAEGATVPLAGGLYEGKITYLANWTGTQAGSTLTGGNDVAIYNIAPVPEPTTLAVLGIAGLGLLHRRRRA
jgi:hypothetical protein